MVAILYANRNTLYRQVPGVEVYDLERDARDYYGPHPVVAHPPCAQWSQLRGLCRPRLEIAKYLAYHALECVEAFGGVLEHPARSRFWRAAGLPEPGSQDERGCTLQVDLLWFGAPVRKPTGLYVHGLQFADLPDVPYRIGEPTHAVSDYSNRRFSRMPCVPKSKRAETPLAMCEWLVGAAKLSGERTNPGPQHSGC